MKKMTTRQENVGQEGRPDREGDVPKPGEDNKRN